MQSGQQRDSSAHLRHAVRTWAASIRPRRSSNTRGVAGRGRGKSMNSMDVARFVGGFYLFIYLFLRSGSGSGVVRDSCAFGYFGELLWVLLCGHPKSLQGGRRKGEHSPGRMSLPAGAAEGTGRLQPGGPAVWRRGSPEVAPPPPIRASFPSGLLSKGLLEGAAVSKPL